MDTRHETGRCVQDAANQDIYYTTLSEALKDLNKEELVQLVQVDVYGANGSDTCKWRKAYQVSEMRISGNEPHLVLTTSKLEEAVQMYLSLTILA